MSFTGENAPPQLTHVIIARIFAHIDEFSHPVVCWLSYRLRHTSCGAKFDNVLNGSDSYFFDVLLSASHAVRNAASRACI